MTAQKVHLVNGEVLSLVDCYPVKDQQYYSGRDYCGKHITLPFAAVLYVENEYKE